MSNPPYPVLSPEEKDAVLQWVRKFKLSSPIKKLSRDMSDGVLVAEIVHQLFPRLVDLHNYTRGFSLARKLDNWDTLNRKVFKKLELGLTPEVINAIACGEPGAVDVVLLEILMRVDTTVEERPVDMAT
uniref:Putative sperm flagellar protein 1 n=1 Tax=Culex tarsalis TaxID=7177 RepID=A0A1Q3FT99_CULTA